MVKLLLAGVVITFTMTTPTFANDYYVDSSCSANGNGADGCATSSGGAGAFRDPQSCLSAVRAGDTCYIKNGAGTYVTSAGAGYSNGDAGFHLDASGTSGSVITIRNYPGHSPLLAACADGSTSLSPCNRAVLSTNGNSYVHITGLRIRGMLDAYANLPSSTSALARGLEIDHLEITQGYSTVDDGNWSGIFIYAYNGSYVHHNYIHDIKLLSGAGAQSSAACIKVFSSLNSVYEYNTCDNSGSGVVPGDLKFSFDDKQDAEGSAWRFNYAIVKSASCFRLQNQNSAMSGIAGVATDSVYQNVCVQSDSTDDTRGVQFEAGGFNHVQIYNNTFVNFTYCHEVLNQNSGKSVLNTVYYNNACQIRGGNVQSYDSGFIYGASDYNAFASSGGFKVQGSVYSTLAAYSAAKSLDAHSLALSNFGFTAGGGDATLYHLTATSPLKNAGRSGGTSAGAAVDQGAYVNGLQCVGHLCGSNSTPPRPPTNLRVTS